MTEHPPDTVAQELIDGGNREYTCALLAYEGEVRTLTMRRTLGGDRTVVAKVESLAVIEAMLGQRNDNAGGWR